MLWKLVKLAVVVALLTSAAGGGWLVAGGPLRGHAEAPATVDADATAAAGFAEPMLEPVEIEDSVAVAGVSKRLNLSGYVVATGTQDGNATVVLLTLPGWRVAGISLNPLTHLPLEQAVTYVFPHLPLETPEVTWAGESQLALGETTVAAGEYVAEERGMRVVVARRTMGGDAVFAVGTYRTDDPDARGQIESLFANVTHG